MPGALAFATLPAGTRAVIILAAVAATAAILDLPAVASVASVTALVLPIHNLTRRHLSFGSAVTPVLATFMLFWLVMLAAIELLSGLSLLGSRVAWTAVLLSVAVGLELIAVRSGPAIEGKDLLQLRPLSDAMHEPYSIVVLPAGLVLGAIFVQSAYLDLFTGINHADGQAFYLARSIRYLQDGNLSTYSTVNDFLPHLHQTISAYLLLFFRSESAIVLLSALFGAFVCLTLFDLSRLTHEPVSLSLLAGLSPLCVTIVSIHLGTSNFDVHTALLILLTIYFLLLYLRTSLQRNLLMAACATSLTLAIKPTFWFAAPGLLILWVVALAVLARLKGARILARVAAVAGLIVLIGGIHYLRNFWVQGFLITPSQVNYGLSDPTIQDRFQLLFFNVTAATTTLLTPSLFVTPETREAITAAFKAINESVGIHLPDPQIFAHLDRSWPNVFDHLVTPFDSDKAGFGTIVPLVIAPAALFVVANALWRRTVFTIPCYLLLFAALYLGALGVALTYSADHVRYLIEMVIPLLVLVPIVIARLPVVAGLLYLAVVTGFMVTDASQAYWENQQRPPDRVMDTPRGDQYATFTAPERFTYYEGARLLDQKYPAEQWPEIYLLKTNSDEIVIEYPFLGPLGRRHLTYWTTDLGQPRPNWPGAMLIVDPDLADTLQKRFSDQIVLDRLSDSVWVALPLDRLRVTWQITPSGDTKSSRVEIEAFVADGRYGHPEFQFAAANSSDGWPIRTLRSFSDSPRFTIRPQELSATQDLTVETRERGSSAVVERVRIPMKDMLER